MRVSIVQNNNFSSRIPRHSYWWSPACLFSVWFCVGCWLCVYVRFGGYVNMCFCACVYVCVHAFVRLCAALCCVAFAVAFASNTAAGCWGRLLVQNLGWEMTSTISWYILVLLLLTTSSIWFFVILIYCSNYCMKLLHVLALSIHPSTANQGTCWEVLLVAWTTIQTGCCGQVGG